MLNERAPVLVGVLIHGSFLKARRCRHWRMRIGGIGRDSIHKRRETRDTLRRAHKDEEQVGWGLGSSLGIHWMAEESRAYRERCERLAGKEETCIRHEEQRPLHKEDSMEKREAVL